MTTLAHRWWLLLVRGIAAVVFGVLAIVFPGLGLLALVALFSAYALVDGVFNIALGVRQARGGERWGVLVAEGVISLVAGLLAILWPAITALVLLFVIAVWAVATGIAEIAAAVKLRKQVRGEWLLGLAGILSIAFGVLIALFPGAGALAVVLWIGAYAIVFGGLLVVLSFRLRAHGLAEERQAPTGGVPTAV